MRNITFIGQTDSTYLFGKGRGKDKGKRRARLKSFLAGKSKEYGLGKKINEFEKSAPIKRSLAGKIIHDAGKGSGIGSKLGFIGGAVYGASRGKNIGIVPRLITGAYVGAVGASAGSVAGGLGGATVGITRAGIIPGTKRVNQMLTNKKKKRF